MNQNIAPEIEPAGARVHITTTPQHEAGRGAADVESIKVDGTPPDVIAVAGQTQVPA